jgi:hypothetical protein
MALGRVARVFGCALIVGCATQDPGSSHLLDRGCYVLRPVDHSAADVSTRWPSSFELADSGRVKPLSDSLSAGTFWQLHKLARRWSADSTTNILFSTGELVTEMSLRSSGDSVFGTADFPTDEVGPEVLRVRVAGTRTKCAEGSPVR